MGEKEPKLFIRSQEFPHSEQYERAFISLKNKENDNHTNAEVCQSHGNERGHNICYS